MFKSNLSPSIKYNLITTTTWTIDLNGYPNWKHALFGPVILFKNQPLWIKSAFTSLLLPNTLFQLIHTPLEEKNTINNFLKTSKAQGFFEYYGHYIVINNDTQFKLTDHPFDFSFFNTISINPNTKSNQVPLDAEPINTHLFDHLLRYYVLNETGEYSDGPGKIEENANKTLTLFITSPLSENQWYCLCQEAKKHNVTLFLYLAPNVLTPYSLKTTMINKPIKIYTNAASRIIITNHIEKTTQPLSSINTQTFDIEDHDFGSIMYRIDFKKTENGYEDFSVTISDIFYALTQGKTIILKGLFPPLLIYQLQPLLIHSHYCINQYHYTLTGKLILVIENDPKQPLHLDWLSDYEQQHHDLTPDPLSPWIIYEETEPTTQHISTFNQENATAFMEKRKTAFFDALNQSHLLQIIGPTASGKTYFIETIIKSCPDVTIHYHIHNWATDNTSKKKGADT